MRQKHGLLHEQETIQAKQNLHSKDTRAEGKKHLAHAILILQISSAVCSTGTLTFSACFIAGRLCACSPMSDGTGIRIEVSSSMLEGGKKYLNCYTSTHWTDPLHQSNIQQNLWGGVIQISFLSGQAPVQWPHTIPPAFMLGTVLLKYARKLDWRSEEGGRERTHRIERAGEGS